MHTAVFINNKRKQKPQSRTKRYINQPEATVQANIATPTSSMKGVDRSEPHALTSRTNAHHLNPVASPCRPTASWEHQPVQPTFDAHHMRTLKAAAAVFHRSIFRSDQSNDLARPAIDAATATDNTPTLRESIIARPSPRPRGATPPRLAAKDAVDAHRSTSCLVVQQLLQKQCPHEGERHRQRRHHPFRNSRIWGSPGAARVRRPWLQWRLAACFWKQKLKKV